MIRGSHRMRPRGDCFDVSHGTLGGEDRIRRRGRHGRGRPCHSKDGDGAQHHEPERGCYAGDHAVVHEILALDGRGTILLRGLFTWSITCPTRRNAPPARRSWWWTITTLR